MEFSKVDRIFSIEKENGSTIELNIVKWGTNTPKYDLRVWRDEDSPLKGFTLSDDEVKRLCESCAEFIGANV